MTSGFRLARAVYRAAVCPEHPEPMMTTLRVSLMDYQVKQIRWLTYDFDSNHS
jgi:hypothetical protein